MHKILVIEDEQDSRDFLQDVLSDKFQVLLAASGEEGLRMARAELPQLILVDAKMPHMDGFTVCNGLRSNEATRHIPVIMITGADDLDARVSAFSAGADDFIAKPFRLSELSARVTSKLRRVEENSGQKRTLQCGNLTLNLDKIEAEIEGKRLPLSVLEFNLLMFLVKNKDRVLSREQILEGVWRDSIVSGRTVDTHMVSLRKKLTGFDHVVATVYSAGYTLRKDDGKGNGESA
jgi:DNA-binding response OmpR family regulator